MKSFNFNNLYGALKAHVIAHKVSSAIVAVILVVGGYESIANAGTAASTETRYAVGTVTTGTIISTVSGTGQVGTTNSVALTSKVSGNLTSIDVTEGQAVKEGQVIATVDSSQAQLDLENAQTTLNDLEDPNSDESLQTEDDLQSANQQYDQSVQALAKDYTNGYSDVTTSFTDLLNVLNGLQTMINSSDATGYLSETNTRYMGDTVIGYRSQALQSYSVAKAAYDSAFTTYNDTPPSSSTSTIAALVSTTYDTVNKAVDAVRDAKITVDYIKNNNLERAKGDSATPEANLTSWTNEINSDLSNLLSIQNSITVDQNSITSAASNKIEKQNALSSLQDPNSATIDAAKLTLEQKQEAYDDYTITSPFDGSVAKLDIQQGDATVNSGEAIATVITDKQVADITLNEVDASKVKIGQKATMTFDAIDGLTVTGTVTQVDLIGTVTQGVVNYGVEITFDQNSDQVKSGMTVTADIDTSVDTDVLEVPNAAIKTSGASSYVQVVPAGTPESTTGETLSASDITNQTVTTGDTDGTYTQILSGLNAGDEIVTRTITATKTTTAAKTPTILSATTGTTGGAAGGRAGGFTGGAGAAAGR